jgi:CelD/BcsL family acetyltransferase involved in cellulose biosynthesis
MLSVDQATLRLDVDIRVEAEFDFLSDEYRAFYGPRRATAFQAPVWMDMIHRRLAPGLNAVQHTVTIRNRGDGALVAVMPFCIQRSMGLALMQPADFGVCDYNCVVADPYTLAMLAEDSAILGRLEEVAAGCNVLLFRKVREDTFDLSRLFPRFRSSFGENAAYHSDIGDDLDEWRKRTIRKKFSKELGRLQRQTEREFGSYEHRPAASDAEVIEAFEFLRASRQGRFEGDLLDNPLYFEFYRDYAVAARAGGEAITYVSYIAGQLAAVLFGVNGDGEFHAVLIGSDTERFGRSSPGIQILYQTIKLRFAEGFRRFDMGLGNTGYKSHFRVEATRLRNYTLARSLGGSAFALVYHHAKPVKNFLKRYVPNVR